EEGHRIGLRRLTEVTVTPAGRIKSSSERSASRFPVGILGLCVAFFGSGVAVPMLVGNDREVAPLPANTTPPSVRLTKSVMLLQELKSSHFVQDLKLADHQRVKITSAVDDAVFHLNALFQN